MTFAADDYETLSRLPSWVTAARADVPEDVAFLSGAALAHLHLVLSRDEVPQSLLRERLALRAAEACIVNSGRPERVGELRDAVVFLQPGDHACPAGEVYLAWRRAVERPLSVGTLHRALPDVSAEDCAVLLDAGQVGPVARAAAVVEGVWRTRGGDAVTAFLLGDAALAQALGWRHIVPLLALGLDPSDLGKSGAGLRAACDHAVTKASVEALRVAAELARRAARLRAVAPKLRAKGAEEAVALFLAREAVAPTSLASLRSGRAARRFCDRLVSLGAVRELTGRETLRLYGV